MLREFDRMVLADVSGETYQSLLVPPPGQQSSPQYSSIGVIHDENEARLAGLVLALIRQAGTLPRQHLTFALAASRMKCRHPIPYHRQRWESALDLSPIACGDAVRPARRPPVLRFFEMSGAIKSSSRAR